MLHYGVCKYGIGLEYFYFSWQEMDIVSQNNVLIIWYVTVDSRQTVQTLEKLSCLNEHSLNISLSVLSFLFPFFSLAEILFLISLQTLPMSITLFKC